jgi:hypothetical protein
MQPRMAILGWGSLLWEEHPEFDQWHDDWEPDGPTLKLEFSRVSSTRLGALTLVIDPNHGAPTRVAWCLSKRKDPDDAVVDLRCREGCPIRYIARMDTVASAHDQSLRMEVRMRSLPGRTPGGLTLSCGLPFRATSRQR